MKRTFITSLLSALLLSATAHADTPAPGLNLTLTRAVLNEDIAPGPLPQTGNVNPASTEDQARPLGQRAASEPRQRIDLPYGSGYEARRAMSTRAMGRGRGR
jgi:hypothetical protein